METAERVRELLNGLDRSVWELTAVTLALRESSGQDIELLRAAQGVVANLGLLTEQAGGTVLSSGMAELVAQAQGSAPVASQTASAVLQCAALLSGTAPWTSQSDSALLAQGAASSQMAAPFKFFLMPALDGLAELFAGEPEMLDVGVGVASMAVEFCRTFPNLRVVGLDVFPRALELAGKVVADAGMADRIELRQQDVATLEDRDRYAVAWLPAPFVPRPALEAGIPRMAAALVPGGWFLIGHPKFRGDPQEDALNRLKATAFGGTPLDGEEAAQLLGQAGLESLFTVPTPEGAPGLTVGRRPVKRP